MPTTLHTGDLLMQSNIAPTAPAEPIKRSGRRRLRLLLVFLLIGVAGLLSSVGELLRRLLLAGGMGADRNTAATASLAALALIFLIHTALVARSVRLILKKGRG
jgi:hypothetical protein